jgi:hypothetical protein
VGAAVDEARQSSPKIAIGTELHRSRRPALDIRHHSDAEDLPTRSAAKAGWDDPDRAAGIEIDDAFKGTAGSDPFVHRLPGGFLRFRV